MKLTDGMENMIRFCQLVGLLPETLNELSSKGQANWYLGVNIKVIDEYELRCWTHKGTKTIRGGTFSWNSKLNLKQILDLMYYWSQDLDSHIFLERHC